MKTFIRITILISILPGFIIDLCIGAAFLMNDGRSDHHNGDWLAEWAFDFLKYLPDLVQVFVVVTMWICAFPAGIVLLGSLLGAIVLIGAFIIAAGSSFFNFLLSGKVHFSLFD